MEILLQNFHEKYKKNLINYRKNLKSTEKLNEMLTNFSLSPKC